MNNAIQANGEAMSISRRAMLGSAAAFAAIVAAPALAKSESINDLFPAWLATRDACSEATSDAEREGLLEAYTRLQERITAMVPASARDLAMQLVVETDDSESDYRASFYARVRKLAMEA
jgi:hypothetical protein